MIWLVLPLAVVAALLTVKHGDPGKPYAVEKPKSGPASPGADGQADKRSPDHYTAEVRKYAREAHVDPTLLMAILYNESDKPHDPELERAWQRFKPDAAFGIANMHKAAFDETKDGRPFEDRRWEDLPDDPALAVRAAAWYLHDLARQLPSDRTSDFSRSDLLALGYVAGAGNMRLFAKGTKPGDTAASYLRRLHGNWSKAQKALEA
ncbi:lytic transglycosylase domain-containing protein [Actinomadura logoneensis]|uniref:Lytic transglycosylase domain-containing protein n=1 Tax=Actinomadura logoneensis TaxID=2293572 RepID=A0A372JLY4_9ACTN|nr:lytic transglycosylase domain-containing protein [Actinomadura logoneensis]